MYICFSVYLLLRVELVIFFDRPPIAKKKSQNKAGDQPDQSLQVHLLINDYRNRAK